MAGEDKLRQYLKRATVDLADARRRLAAVEEKQHEPIAVVGMACRFPGADTVDAYWRLLAEGRSGVLDDVPNGRYDLRPQIEQHGVYTTRGGFLGNVESWDAGFFGSSPQEALRMDPQQRLLMELAWEALEDAGTPPPGLAGSRTGVMVGLSDILQYCRVQQDHEGQGMLLDPYAGQGASSSVVAGRLAYHFDLRGPAMTLDTACSSSLVAVHQAGTALRRGECDLALAAGCYLTLHTDMYVNACALSMLAPDGLGKTFDASADGYVLGEGAGVVVLARLSDALRTGRRILAVIRGSAVNQDGRSNGLTAPNRGAQVDVIRRALAAAGAAPDEIGYVEAHGSGTALGDAIELGALADVFGGRSEQRPLRVGAVKTNIGHTQAAAGMAGLIKTVLVLGRGEIPANLNFTDPNETALANPALQPVTSPQPLAYGEEPAGLAGVSSFGWCGTNAHLVLEAAPPAEPRRAAAPVAGSRSAAASELSPEAEPHLAAVRAADPSLDAMPGVEPHVAAAAATVPRSAVASVAEPSSAAASEAELLPVSAADEVALRERLGALAATGGSLGDLAHTLQLGRAALEFRRAVVAADTEQAAALLAGAADTPGVRAGRERPKVAFLLPGVGDQYRGLGQDLYRSEPAFAVAVDQCVEIARTRCGVDLATVFTAQAEATDGFAMLLGRGTTGEHDRAESAHLFLFTVEYALARLLDHYGVRPDLLIGYSLGEYVAACLAGVFSLSDALWVVTCRARLIEAAPDGGMLAAAAGAEHVAEALSGTAVDVAALNGPTMTVLSGTPEGIAAAERLLAERGIAARRLRSAHPFHSSLLAPARAELAEVVGSVARRKPSVPIVSNVTGAPLTDEQAVDPGYWADHLTSPVRFADGLRACAELGADVYVELGAGQTLGGLLRQNTTDTDLVALGTLPAQWAVAQGPRERTALLETCARLWETGVALDWSAVRRTPGRLISLPTYPFQRSRYWPQGTARQTQDRPAEATDLCYAPTWQRDVTTSAAPTDQASPLVVFTDENGVGTRLAELAEAAGSPVIEVAAGTGYRDQGRRIVIDPTEPPHYRALAEKIAASTAPGPVRVVHLWSLLDPARTPVFAEDAELRASIGHGFDSLLLAVQALAETAATHGLRLLTATAGAAEVLGGDCTAPDRALAHGFARVAAAEFQGLTWRGVDLDPAAEPADGAARLAEELARGPWQSAGPDGTGMAAWRGGRRYRKSWDLVPLPETADFPVRADGSYLITGGTRGLGLALARHLVSAGARSLALVGRTDLAAAAAADPDGRAAQSLAAIAELEAAGAEVLLLTADVGDPGQLRAALWACRERFGTLTGVLHAAGVPAGGMTFRQSPARARTVLAPKVLAMGPLAELLAPGTDPAERPELLVLYSSAVSVFGGLGEGDYCAANSVLDAYGSALADLAGPATTVLSVAWGPWRHDDWQAVGLGGALADKVRAHREAYGFTDEGGCALLGRMVSGARGALVAVRQPLAEGLREWAAITDLGSLVDTTAAETATTARFPRPQLRTPYAAPRTELETVIADSWGKHLGIEGVGIHDPFFDLGGNSLVGMAMVAAIEKQLDRRIAPAVLFEHPTVAAFAAALDGSTAAQAATGTAHETGSARGERRRRARGAQASTAIRN